MKRHFSAIVLAISLAYAGFPALAGDTVNITQSGINNKADTTQSANASSSTNAITINQKNDLNDANVSQSNLQGTNTASVNQTGGINPTISSNNKAKITQSDSSNVKAAIVQTGNANEASISQSNIRGSGTASINQTAIGTSNTAKIEQSDSADVKASITQDNNFNYAQIFQLGVTDATANILEAGFISTVVQDKGSNGVVATIKNGGSNQAHVTQSNVNVGNAIINNLGGAGNAASIAQHDGKNLYAKISTDGHGRQSFSTVVQTGSFQRATIEQGKPGSDLSDSSAYINQDGTMNDAAIIQAGGSFNNATIAQTGLGGLNMAKITQAGSANGAYITQNGSNFNATVSQTGDSNYAKVSQHF